MTKELTTVLVLVFAAACLGLTMFMPLAELGLLNPPDSMSQTARHLAESAGLMESLAAARDLAAGLLSDAQKDPNYQYYVYSLFLGLSMVAAAIAINVVGRQDSEEKTVLPLKK